MTATIAASDLISRVEQFYYQEARLLDERKFQQWFALVDQSIEYSMPGRFVAEPDPRDQGDECYLDPERELERADGGQGSPIRMDRYMDLLIRASRPFNSRAWAESPPPRTRRMISNVEVQEGGEGSYRTFSNFFMFYSHVGADNHIYAGGRRDTLRADGNTFRIMKREVITDWDLITVPTLALIF